LLCFNNRTQVIWEKYGLVFQTLPSQTAVILKMINKNTMNGLKADWAAREWRNVH